MTASPNPFQNNIEIKFTLDKISTVDIYLYDSLGRLIQSFPKGKKNGGTQSTQLIIKDLEKGIYIIPLQTDEGIESIKVVH